MTSCHILPGLLSGCLSSYPSSFRTRRERYAFSPRLVSAEEAGKGLGKSLELRERPLVVCHIGSMPPRECLDLWPIARVLLGRRPFPWIRNRNFRPRIMILLSCYKIEGGRNCQSLLQSLGLLRAVRSTGTCIPPFPIRIEHSVAGKGICIAGNLPNSRNIFFQPTSPSHLRLSQQPRP